MKNKIPEFLQAKINLKHTPTTKNFPIEIKNFMITYSLNYQWNFGNNIRKIFKVMRQGIAVLPKCGLEGCENNVIFSNEEQLLPGCCRSHSQKISYLKKYGVDNPMKDEIIKEKFYNTMKERYGATSTMHSPILKKKFNNSMQKKYGCDWAMQNSEIFEKTKVNNIEKFGYENPMQHKIFQNKMKVTNLKKYGFEYAMHNPKIAEKAFKNSFKKKEYIWNTGVVSWVQGYESIVLKELEAEGYTFDDIKIVPTDMPKIMYQLDETEHRYYPDIFIPKDNIIIEVKSAWTLNLDWDKNQAKFKATRKLGYDFRVEIR